MQRAGPTVLPTGPCGPAFVTWLPWQVRGSFGWNGGCRAATLSSRAWRPAPGFSGSSLCHWVTGSLCHWAGHRARKPRTRWVDRDAQASRDRLPKQTRAGQRARRGQRLGGQRGRTQPPARALAGARPPGPGRRRAGTGFQGRRRHPSRGRTRGGGRRAFPTPRPGPGPGFPLPCDVCSQLLGISPGRSKGPGGGRWAQSAPGRSRRWPCPPSVRVRSSSMGGPAVMTLSDTRQAVTASLWGPALTHIPEKLSARAPPQHQPRLTDPQTGGPSSGSEPRSWREAGGVGSQPSWGLCALGSSGEPTPYRPCSGRAREGWTLQVTQAPLVASGGGGTQGRLGRDRKEAMSGRGSRARRPLRVAAQAEEGGQGLRILTVGGWGPPRPWRDPGLSLPTLSHPPGVCWKTLPHVPGPARGRRPWLPGRGVQEALSHGVGTGSRARGPFLENPQSMLCRSRCWPPGVLASQHGAATTSSSD